MFPTYVALVPYDNEGRIPHGELAQVAAALQVQVLRDFAPIWGMSGSVSVFPSLEDVPPGYLPLAIVDTSLPLHSHGFHFSVGGTPFALVKYRPDWSLAASHELLEMICDPSGQVTRPGPSLIHPAEYVDYLVEVCDPCEHSTYDINGVTVSDFVTPDYYDLVAGDGSHPSDGPRYSFLGKIKEPRQILGEGYLSWRTRLPDSQFYQAFAGLPGRGDSDDGGPFDPNLPVDVDQLTIGPVLTVTSRVSREGADLHKHARRLRDTPSRGPYYRASESSARYGIELREEINELLHYVRKRERQRPPSIDEIIRVLEELHDSSAEIDGDAIARRLDIEELLGGSADRHLHQKADYARILEYLKEQKRLSGIFGPDMFDPGLALWMSMHIA